MFHVAVYLAAIIGANLSIAHFGPWIAPINSFLLIGLDLSLRDRLHERWSNNLWPRMLGLIAAAGAISYVLNPAAGMIAIASVVAFTSAALTDSAVYHSLKGKVWAVKANGSNVAGAAVDSVIFPLLAFGGMKWEIIAAMFAAKVAGGAVWTYVLPRTQAT